MSISINPRLAFLIEYLELSEATDEPDATWETFQFRHLNNTSLFGIEAKSRQVGFSWVIAAEAVASSILTPRDLNIFVSINLDEAKEKIRYAKQIIAALDGPVRPALVTDNNFELELENGSRIISHPCRPVRGKARARVYLDEFAHYAKAKEIYSSALPAATRGGQIRIGSTPLGAKGLFWEIYTERMRSYPGYVRGFTPWWSVRALCTDTVSAATHAPKMQTHERVQAFGSSRISEIYENIPLEDFQQEYECQFVDETTAWITWEEIHLNQTLAQAGDFLHWHAKSVDEALAMVNDVAEACRAGRIEVALAGGMDVGRKKDLTEMAFVGRSTSGQLPCRFQISLGQTPFEAQKAVATACMEKLPMTLFLVDQTGLGMQLAEDLMKRHGARVQGVDFTGPAKELWSVELKVRMQRGSVPIPADRDLAYQIHSIKKTITAAKNAIYDTSGGETHHADKYWALALAVWAAGGKARRGDRTVTSAPVVKRLDGVLG